MTIVFHVVVHLVFYTASCCENTELIGKGKARAIHSSAKLGEEKQYDDPLKYKSNLALKKRKENCLKK